MKEIIMSKKNNEGKEIIKKVPENMSSDYLNIGWKIVEEAKQPIKSNKEDK